MLRLQSVTRVQTHPDAKPVEPCVGALAAVPPCTENGLGWSELGVAERKRAV